ncbi:NucA/NucB deoxyribonuclease domain-containing protein [Streptomyces lydicus]|uniref:NucA/NucB deoxyribonuclease domain-containing protein n=1 Tax=Streptomyces lydicus TaxID=47763 RepID=UPI0036E92573
MIENATLNVTSTTDGSTIGQLNMTVTQDLTLSYNSNQFAENFDIKFTSGWGQITDVTVSLGATCGGTCTATSYFPAGSATTVGSGITTSIAYADSTTTVNTTNTSYALTWTNSYSSTVWNWTSPSYRCDNEIGGISAGCIAPWYAPTLSSMQTLPNIDANILNIQNAGPHHYGRYAANGNPLHKNSALADANRAVACPSSLTPPPNQSCDEYPFAATSEGASQTQQPDWGWAWVPVTEQNSQGGLLTTFYRQQRVLDGDAFWVAA